MRVRARGGGRAAEVAVVVAERRVERDEEALAAAGREAQRSPTALGSSAVGRALATTSLDAVAADALADAQVPDRRVVDRVAVEQQHGVGELEVGHRRLQRGRGERARTSQRQLAAGARRQVARAEVVAQQLTAAGRPPRWRSSPPASAAARGPAFLSALAGGVERLLPRRGHQLDALAHQRRGDALVGVHVLVGEAALVAQPAVVDARRCRGRARASRGRRARSARRCTAPGRSCAACRAPSMSHGRARKR